MPGPDRRRAGPLAATLLSGLLLGLAFCPLSALPKPLEAGLPPILGLLAPVPFLAALARGGGAGLAAWLGGLWSVSASAWLVDCYPGLGWVAFGMVIPLAAGLTAPLGWALGRLRERHGAAVMLTWAPVVWCGWEWFRAIQPLGSTWCSLAHTLWALPPLIQVCELAGFGPLTIVLATISAGLARAVAGVPGSARQVGWGALMLAACLLHGAVRLRQVDVTEGQPVRVALVQCMTPKELKRPDQAEELFWEHMRLSRQAEPGSDLIVWPETAVPGRIMTWDWSRRELERLARERCLTIIAGGTEPEPPSNPEAVDITSCAFVIGPDGRRWDTGRKVHLVIFAEYTPLRRYLPASVTGLTEQFTAGARLRSVDTPLGKLAVPICYESVFPGDVNAMVRDGARALIVITNDDQLSQWGARQHFQQAVFRAVEHRRWIARCANSGISAVIDPLGRVVSETAWAEKTVHHGFIHLRDDVTPARYVGRGVGAVCALLVLALIVPWRRRRG